MSIDLQQVAINPTGVTPLYQSDAHSIYWVGVAEESAFRCNVYLIVDGDEVILVDPGSRAHFAQVKERISSVIDPMKVTGAIVCHQDPDVAASLLDWLALNPAIKVYTTPRTHVLLPYYDIEYDYVDVEENSEVTLPSGAVLRFIASPFLHFPGAFTTYDVATQALFSGEERLSGDIIGGEGTGKVEKRRGDKAQYRTGGERHLTILLDIYIVIFDIIIG